MHDSSHWLGDGDGAQQEMQDELWMVFQQQWRVGKCPLAGVLFLPEGGAQWQPFGKSATLSPAVWVKDAGQGPSSATRSSK